MSVQMQLDDFALTRLHVNWRPPSKPTVDIGELTSRFDYNVAINAKDKKRFKLDLYLKIVEIGKQQAAVGYEIEADLVGIFSFPEETDQETRQKLVRVNGVNLLYSTFRGVLCGVTGVFPGGKLVLPTIMPVEIVKAVETRRLAARSATKALASAKT